MIGISKTINPIIGGISLVGVGRKSSKDFPLSFGNYFSFVDDNNKPIKIWNFWYENFVEAQNRFLSDGMVSIVSYPNGSIIYDWRIPSHWYHKDLCFTGGYAPEQNEIDEIKSLMVTL